MWRLWSKALGTKEGSTDSEANKVAAFRTIILIQVVLTNAFIIAGVVHHW